MIPYPEPFPSPGFSLSLDAWMGAAPVQAPDAQTAGQPLLHMGRGKQGRNGNECGHTAPKLIVRCDGGQERSGFGRAQQRDLERKRGGGELGVRMFGLDRAFPAGLCLCLVVLPGAPPSSIQPIRKI